MIRQITEKEAWRLMGFTDEDFEKRFADLADEIAARNALTDEDVYDINSVLYAHKYNALWTVLFDLTPYREQHP